MIDRELPRAWPLRTVLVVVAWLGLRLRTGASEAICWVADRFLPAHGRALRLRPQSPRCSRHRGSLPEAICSVADRLRPAQGDALRLSTAWFSPPSASRSYRSITYSR